MKGIFLFVEPMGDGSGDNADVYSKDPFDDPTEENPIIHIYLQEAWEWLLEMTLRRMFFTDIFDIHPPESWTAEDGDYRLHYLKENVGKWMDYRLYYHDRESPRWWDIERLANAAISLVTGQNRYWLVNDTGNQEGKINWFVRSYTQETTSGVYGNGGIWTWSSSVKDLSSGDSEDPYTAPPLRPLAWDRCDDAPQEIEASDDTDGRSFHIPKTVKWVNMQLNMASLKGIIPTTWSGYDVYINNGWYDDDSDIKIRLLDAITSLGATWNEKTALWPILYRNIVAPERPGQYNSYTAYTQSNDFIVGARMGSPEAGGPGSPVYRIEDKYILETGACYYFVIYELDNPSWGIGNEPTFWHENKFNEIAGKGSSSRLIGRQMSLLAVTQPSIPPKSPHFACAPWAEPDSDSGSGSDSGSYGYDFDPTVERATGDVDFKGWPVDNNINKVLTYPCCTPYYIWRLLSSLMKTYYTVKVFANVQLEIYESRTYTDDGTSYTNEEERTLDVSGTHILEHLLHYPTEQFDSYHHYSTEATSKHHEKDTNTSGNVRNRNTDVELRISNWILSNVECVSSINSGAYRNFTSNIGTQLDIEYKHNGTTTNRSYGTAESDTPADEVKMFPSWLLPWIEEAKLYVVYDCVKYNHGAIESEQTRTVPYSGDTTYEGEGSGTRIHMRKRGLYELASLQANGTFGTIDVKEVIEGITETTTDAVYCTAIGTDTSISPAEPFGSDYFNETEESSTTKSGSSGREDYTYYNLNKSGDIIRYDFNDNLIVVVKWKFDKKDPDFTPFIPDEGSSSGNG